MPARVFSVLAAALFAPPANATPELDMSTCQSKNVLVSDTCNFGLNCDPGTYAAPDTGKCIDGAGFCPGPVMPAVSSQCVTCTGGPNVEGAQLNVYVTCCQPMSAAAIQAEQTARESGSSTATGTTAPATDASKNSTSTADKTFQLSKSLLGNSAAQTVAFGAIDCLEGMNKTFSDQEAGGRQVAQCEGEVNAAKQMHEKADQAAQRGGTSLGPLEPDASMMASERAERALLSFEKNYGANGKEFVSSLVGSSSTRDALEAALKAKWDAEKTAALLDATSPAMNDVPVDLTGTGAPRPKAALKEKLSKALAAQNLTHATPSRVPSGKAVRIDNPDQNLQSLTPLEGTFAADSEQTLFDVIRRKYREKWGMLVPYRAPH